MKIKKYVNWPISVKITAIAVITSIVLIAGVVFYVVPLMKSKLLNEKRTALSSVVDTAYSLIEGYQERSAKGEFSAKEAQKRVLATIKDLRYKKDEYFWINDMGLTMIMHPIKPELDGKDLSSQKDPKGTPIFVEMVKTCNEKGEGFVEYMWSKPGKSEPVPKISYVKLFKPWGWVVGSGIYVDDVAEELAAVRNRILIATVALLTLIMTISLLIARAITKPLNEAVLSANLLADGDLTQQIVPRSTDETGQMLESMKNMTLKLREVVAQTREASNQVSIAADQIADANQGFSQRITEQAASIEETTSTMEEISATIKHTAENAKEANKLTQAAKTTADSGIAVMSDTINAINDINKSSSKIANISNVIEEIAFQTNLLALNAAVEAARAGEHGKGFAVVASEIRSLAQRASESAKEINVLIEDSVEKTGKGVQLAEELNRKLGEIGISIKKVTDMMDEIAAASAEQSTGINQVNTAMIQVEQVTQQNASLVEEMSASTEEMSAQARELLNLISFFKVGAERINSRDQEQKATPRRHSSTVTGQKTNKSNHEEIAGVGKTVVTTMNKSNGGGFEDF